MNTIQHITTHKHRAATVAATASCNLSLTTTIAKTKMNSSCAESAIMDCHFVSLAVATIVANFQTEKVLGYN